MIGGKSGLTGGGEEASEGFSRGGRKTFGTSKPIVTARCETSGRLGNFRGGTKLEKVQSLPGTCLNTERDATVASHLKPEEKQQSKGVHQEGFLGGKKKRTFEKKGPKLAVGGGE